MGSHDLYDLDEIAVSFTVQQIAGALKPGYHVLPTKFLTVVLSPGASKKKRNIRKTATPPVFRYLDR